MSLIKITKKSEYLIISLLLMLVVLNKAQASEITKQGVIDLVNQAREVNGIEPLLENYKLSVAALEKSQDMIKNNYFAHVSPTNVTPWDWFEDSEYDYKYAGENLAIDFVTLESQHRAWMQSPDHRKNILNPKFQEIGVAVGKGLIDGRESLITVQMFGAREDFKVAGAFMDKQDSAVTESEKQNETIYPNNSVNAEEIAGLAKSETKRNVNILWVLAAFVLATTLTINPFILAVMWVRKKISVRSQKALHIKVMAIQ